MNFYPLNEGLNNYFLTKRCNHERQKKHFARPWGNEGLVYYLHVIVPHEGLEVLFLQYFEYFDHLVRRRRAPRMMTCSNN